MQARLVFFLAAMLLPGAKVHAQSFDLEKALALPVTPGAIALLVEHTSDERARARLVEGLKDIRSEVRAAAARVVNAASVAALVPNVLQALAIESDADAGREMTMAVAGYADSESVVLDAARRLGIASGAATSLAAGSGSRALELLPVLRDMDPKLPLAFFLRIASRGDLNALARIAATALREKDEALWKAYLQAARESDQEVGGGSLFVAVALEKLRAVTLWHALASGANLEVPSDLVLEGEEAFLAELLARRGGRKSQESKAWIAARQADQETLLSGIQEPDSNAILLLLTKVERRALSAQLRDDAKAFDDWHERAEDAADDEDVLEEPPATPAMRTVSDFPPGFVQSVLFVTGCAPTTSVGIGSAEIEFSLAGRPRRISFDSYPIEFESCAAASRALILNSVSTPYRLSAYPDRSRLFTLLEPDFLSCLSEGPYSVPQADRGIKLDPPKLVSKPTPVYPPSAAEENVSGEVILEAIITASGCVRDIRTLRSPDRRLTLASIVAVSRWRYEPARVAGEPVALLAEVIVTFN